MLKLLNSHWFLSGVIFPLGTHWTMFWDIFDCQPRGRKMETMDAVNIFQSTRQSIKENDLVQKINSPETEYPWGKAYQWGSVCVCSVVSDSFATSWTVAHQAPLSMLSFPSPGDRPRDQSHISGVFCFGQWILCNLAPPGKPKEYLYLWYL